MNSSDWTSESGSALVPSPHTSPKLTQRPSIESQSVDVARLSAWLEEYLNGFKAPLALERFAGGQSNPTFKLTTPGRVYVLRTKPGPSMKLVPSAHAIEREFKVMRALRKSAVPVPEVFCLCEDESVIGRAFYVMEYIQGRVFWDQALPGMERTDRSAIYEAMVCTLAALHTTRAAPHGLGEFGKPANYFERQISRWAAQHEAASMSAGFPDHWAIEEMDKLAEWLPAHIPADSAVQHVAIVHGDYRLDNLMFHPSEPRVLGVLDWELSTLGHPLADFSYHCMSWHVRHGPDSRGIGGLDLHHLGIPVEREYIDRYCDLTGFATASDLMANWNFYMAYNMFRMAAILQGIATRAAAGTAANPAVAGGADRMAKLAWSFARRA